MSDSLYDRWLSTDPSVEGPGRDEVEEYEKALLELEYDKYLDSLEDEGR